MENKTWIIIVLVILVALVGYNFTGMTGQITGEQITKITVNPTTVSFAKDEAMTLLTINVKIGTIGVDRSLKLYRVTPIGSERVGSGAIDACTTYICDKDTELTFKLSATVGKGTYFFRGERDNYDNAGHDIKFDSNKFIVQ